LEVAGKKSTPAWQEAAKTATRRQRLAAALQARRALVTAEKAEQVATAARRAQAKKQVAMARQALTKAEAALKQPETTAYTPRKVTTYPSNSTGRRLAFARWIANRNNPLAARVAVNHIWQRHFGRALAPGVFELGRNGQRPTHPALLDWLAVEFMERGWSMKKLHRLIVTSATYRQASTPLTANLERDPDNVYLWRLPPRRLEAEVVRDAIFFVAGQLDLRMGGPDIPHAQGLTVPRRSLYFQHAAEKQMEFLRIFDTAAVTECYERKQAIMPQQALALVNSDLVLQHARLIARELQGKSGNFIHSAFERVLGRGPTAEEEATCAAFLQEQSARLAGDGQVRARENLVHVLMNHHEFSTLR
jgi:hypothetical protein